MVPFVLDVWTLNSPLMLNLAIKQSVNLTTVRLVVPKTVMFRLAPNVKMATTGTISLYVLP